MVLTLHSHLYTNTTTSLPVLPHLVNVASQHRNHNQYLNGAGSPQLFHKICTWFFHSLQEVEVNAVVTGPENENQWNIYVKVALFTYTLVNDSKVRMSRHTKIYQKNVV